MLGHEPPPANWGRDYLRQCGLDPDDPNAVRTAYEICREAHGDWLFGEGDMDADTYYTLVDAIRSSYSWDEWPWDWPPPIVVRLTTPLRNLLPRTKLREEQGGQ